mmetsp:Transcript_17017/g.54256  ORF Transcript_17017/g.54256 Transcript_17017/m.54256 type:complete len:263 (-) Transcript_17017:8699-9487(-)
MGAMRSRIMEYLTLALTQAASGAAATETRKMTACSKELAFCCSSFITSLRWEGCTFRASKLMTSSLTERFPRNALMLLHEVSDCPMSLRTPSSTSRMASGGILRLRISLMLSLLICPTALRAASSIGSTSRSSSSIPVLRCVSTPSSSDSLICSASTSVLEVPACAIAAVICDRACSACACFSSKSTRWEDASRESPSTAVAASCSLLRPLCKNDRCSSCSVRLAEKIFSYICTNHTNCRGVAPRWVHVPCTYPICSTICSS